MKTINKIKIVCSLLIFMVLSGCNSFLERDHPTGITDNDFWKTMAECEAALAQCKRLPHGTYHTSFSPNVAWVHMEGMTDNQYFQSNFRQEVINLGNGSVTPNTGGYITNIWQQYYICIRRCNRFLQFVDNAYFNDEFELMRMKADATVWRAWYHMQLLLLYGRHDGIPIVKEAVTPEENFLPRSTVEECLDFLNAEFDKVINNTELPFLWDESRRSRMSRSSALVLKMDLNLQFKRYEVAKACAKQIIDEGVFELHYTNATDEDPGKHFRDMFRYVGKINNERILFTASGLNQAWFRLMGTPLGGQGTGAVLKSLVDEFETIDGKTLNELTASEKGEYERKPLYKPRDPRLYASVFLPGDSTTLSGYIYEPFDESGSDYIGTSGASRSGYMIKKFLDEQDWSTGRGSLDFVLYRYAEVLLSYVESLVETGEWQHPDVEKYINMVRNRAGMPDMDKSIYNSQEKVRELYRRERRVELAFEGKRYDDIRRWEIGSQTMTGRIEGAWNPNANSFVQIEERLCTFPKNDSWPLPQVEVTSNPNIHQPTGW